MNVQFYAKKSDPNPQHSLQTSKREEKNWGSIKKNGEKLPDNFRNKKDDFTYRRRMTSQTS
jgi:hypothetical protein